MRLRALPLILALLLPAAVLADHHAMAPLWINDESHTRITFEVTHLGFSTMPGIFRDFDVDFRFDPESPADSSLKVTIDAASIDMFHDELNEHLRNEDFFDVANHPRLTFVSTTVTPTGEDTATVTGDLTLLGVTQPVTFDVTLNDLGPHPFDPERTVAGFDAVGALDRTAFGMDYAAPAVGAEILFRLTGEFSPPDA
jgi:polyisoprenoid-binding protein YceI